MTETQRYALVSMMDAIIAVPWCSTELRAQATALRSKLTGKTFGDMINEIFDGFSNQGKRGPQ